MQAHDWVVTFLGVDGFIAILDSYEDYIIGALILYIDIITIFLNLLKLLGNR